jgi:uncharacterized protein (TIGR03118 family)
MSFSLYRRPALERRKIMMFSSWLRNWRRFAPAPRRRTQTSSRQPASFRPRLEALEDRLTPSTGYVQTNLVSYLPGLARFTDPNLNGWGMTSLPNGTFVVANAFANGTATSYTHSGKELPLTITVPVEAAESGVLGISTQYGHPTGVVYNPTKDFVITNPNTDVSAPATLIFDTLDGIICGWNPRVDATHAIVLYDALADTGAPAVYTSLEIGQNVLYATDFLHNQLDIIGTEQAQDGTLTNINPISCAGLGVSNNLNSSVTTDPNSWVWSVSAVNNILIVTFADLFGPVRGGGAVDVFNTDGGFLYQIDANDPTSNVAANATGRLENPWGVTLAPANFGTYSNDLLVGNVWGHGNIDVYKPDPHGNYTIYAGQLSQPDGTPIAIKGLWDLEFGDGTPHGGKTNQLFFDAGPNKPGDATGGLFGVIRAAGHQDGDDDDDPVREVAAPAQPIQVLPASYLGEEAGNQVWISPMGMNPGGVNMPTAADSSGRFGSWDTPSELGQTESLSSQMAMDQVAKVTDTLSNVLKKVDDAGSALTQNLK